MSRAGTHVGFYLNTDGRAQRYWVHDRVLVGGSIMSLEDADALRSLGITHVLSAEDQQDDAGRWPDHRRTRLAFVDDGQTIPLDLVHKMIGYAKNVLVVLGDDDNTLYVHCKMGGSRGPTLGYIVLRAVFGYSPDAAMAAIRATRADWTPHLNYIHSVERALATRNDKVDEMLAWARVMLAYSDTPAPQKLQDVTVIYKLETLRRMLAEAYALLPEGGRAELWKTEYEVLLKDPILGDWSL